MDLFRHHHTFVLPSEKHFQILGRGPIEIEKKRRKKRPRIFIRSHRILNGDSFVCMSIFECIAAPLPLALFICSNSIQFVIKRCIIINAAIGHFVFFFSIFNRIRSIVYSGWSYYAYAYAFLKMFILAARSNDSHQLNVFVIVVVFHSNWFLNA